MRGSAMSERGRRRGDEASSQPDEEVAMDVGQVVIKPIKVIQKTEVEDMEANASAGGEEDSSDEEEEELDEVDELSRLAQQVLEDIIEEKKKSQIGLIKHAMKRNRSVINKRLAQPQMKVVVQRDFPLVGEEFNSKIAKVTLYDETGKLQENYGTVNMKIEHCSKIPNSYQFCYAPRNFLVEEEKVLHHIPYLGDAQVNKSEKSGVLHELIECYDNKIHDDGEKISDEEFKKVVEELKIKTNEARVVQTKRTVNKMGAQFLPPPLTCRSNLDLVFDAIHRAFPGEGSPARVRQRYDELNNHIKKPKHAYCPNLDGPASEPVTRERALNSFKTLFCRRCLMYDCLLHSSEMDMSQETASTIVIRKKDFTEKVPLPESNCFFDCSRAKDIQSKQIALNSTVQTLIRSMWPSMSYNYCVLTEVVRPVDATITCAQVAQWCMAEYGSKVASPIKMPIMVENNAIAPKRKHKKQPSVNRKVQKPKGSLDSRLQSWQKMAGKMHRTLTTHSHNYRPCIPSEHHQNEDGSPYLEKCTSKCHCVINGTFCEKFCLCPPDCPYRFPGCKCNAQCSTKQCPCFAASRECDPDLCTPCEAGALDNEKRKCTNIGIQRLSRKHLLVAPSDLGKKAGWGCFTKDKLAKNDLISEYCGEVISQNEADKRGIVYDQRKVSFLFSLNSEFAVDATRKGNKIRFANHSSNPNCYAKIMKVIGEHRIGIYAKRDIEAGEELFFDYKYGPNAVEFVPIEKKRDKL